MDIVTIKNLKKYFGKGESLVKALDGVDLNIEKGKFTVILGTSGSGKTTLLNMMGGLERPTQGSVVVDGTELTALNESQRAVFRRNRIGFVYQNFNLIPTLNVRENILFSLDLGNTAPDREYLGEVLDMLRLNEKLTAFPHQLSGGGQQRVAIARALIGKPAIILADEPTGSLDSKTSQNVLGLLKTSAEIFHQTLVMITHNLEIAQLADRVVHMEDGKIKESGSVDEHQDGVEYAGE